jgi:hypothetical protein
MFASGKAFRKIPLLSLLAKGASACAFRFFVGPPALRGRRNAFIDRLYPHSLNHLLSKRVSQFLSIILLALTTASARIPKTAPTDSDAMTIIASQMSDIHILSYV